VAQNARDANEEKAKEWINDVLIPAFSDWARSSYTGGPEDIKPTIIEPNPMGKTLEWRQQPFPIPRASITLGIESLTSPKIPDVPVFVSLSYTIRLKVSAQGVIGFIEFAVEGEVKQPVTEEPDILSWDKERIRHDIVDRMCRIQNET